VDQSPHRRVHDPRTDEQQRDPVHLGREDLDAAVPERPAPGRRSRRDGYSEEREPERGGVRQHVAGVGEEGERPRDDARRELRAHQPGDEDERDRERTPV
jgi:hypothetical protein